MTEALSLAPCPFCGGAMQFRKALWPSDGNTDAIIHAEPTECGMPAFDIGSTDEGVIAAWNRRALLAQEPPSKQMQHVGECATDDLSQQVCEGMYKDRCDDNLALCEALRAVYALYGEDKQVKKIVHDAIKQHGIDDA